MLLETWPFVLSLLEPLIFVLLDGNAVGAGFLSLLFEDVVTMELKEDDDDVIDAAEDGGGKVFGLTGYL